MRDIDVIKQIEKELTIKLKKLEKVEWNTKGYALNENEQVVGLSLYGVPIKSFSQQLFHLTELPALTTLYLQRTGLSEINIIKDLTHLITLDVADNEFTKLSPVQSLTELEFLNSWGNKIDDISSLSALRNLQTLYLNSNLIVDISPLAKLDKLSTLNLYSNKISDITPLENLRKLSYLALSSNLISDISPLRNLQKLLHLYLDHNPIDRLELWITGFENMDVVWSDMGWPSGNLIIFGNNPLISPPPEIVKQGKDAIKNYFEQLGDQKEDYLFEAKMLIVGEPGAGKTTLAWKTENPNCELPKEEDTTKGIDVKQYYFPLQNEDFPTFPRKEKLEHKRFRLNLWDFGGQQIYKATHRFFLSKRSLYALVADSRNENTDFNYWLHIIEMFGGESPLLIVLNEKFNRKRNLDIPAMRNRFTNITEVIDVDFAEEDKSRIYALQNAIKYYVSKLPHIGSPVPAKWTAIRTALEDDPHNTIGLQDYLKICQANGIERTKDALVLSQYFHDIGVFLHFQDDELLNKTIFLKSNWATNAVYKILDHELLNQNNGRFTKTDAKSIWSDNEFEFVRDELLRLMQKFFLTYEIGHSGIYIVPERLQERPPAYKWNDNNNLLLNYKYDLFMPKGILSQFIVQMNHYISNHDYVWKRGVILERDETRAEVLESYDARFISIRVSGKNRRDFMTIITEQFDQINTPYEKMKVDKLIPCYCDECKSKEKPYLFEYTDLKRRLEKGRQEIECGRSYEMVNVRRLIDEVINEDKRKIPEWRSMHDRTSIQTQRVERTGLFISYSHKDKDWLLKVQPHLRVLEKIGVKVNLWDDTQIKAGMKWREEIEKALSSAKVAVLLISTDFLNSEFISHEEIPALLKAANDDGATILPLILEPSLYTSYPNLKDYQSVNDPSKPLSKLSKAKQDEVLVSMAQRIMELME